MKHGDNKWPHESEKIGPASSPVKRPRICQVSNPVGLGCRPDDGVSPKSATVSSLPTDNNPLEWSVVSWRIPNPAMAAG